MKLNAYLTFDGQCRAAFEFYQHIFDGEIAMMMTHGNSPMAAHTPPDWQNAILHARLLIGDQVLMGSDNPPEHQQKAEGFSVNINVDTPAEAERIFAALVDGGTASMPLQDTFWAKRFGMCVDRFGTPWMVNCEHQPG